MLTDGAQLLLPKGDAGKISTTVDLPDSVNAPVVEGQELGTLTVLVDGQERTKLKLVAETGVERLRLGEIYKGLLCTLFCVA